jgi:transposase
VNPEPAHARRRDFIACLLRNGYSPKEVAARMGVNVSRIRQIAKMESGRVSRELEASGLRLATTQERLIRWKQISFTKGIGAPSQ